METIREEFKSIYQMLNVMDARPHNYVMRDENSSQSDNYEFTGTETYESAKELFRNGYKEILPRIMQGMQKSVRVINKNNLPVNKALPKNMFVGFVPNIPNMLNNNPNNMINVLVKPIKRKVAEIIYIMDGGAFTDKEIWINAGAVMLEAIKFIERGGTRIKLNVCFCCGEGNSQYTLGMVNVKNYGEKLDLQKLCFPIAHPSMLRRFGFKWIETAQGLKDERYSAGYGRSMCDKYSLKEIKKLFKFPKAAYAMNAQWIAEHGYDVMKLIKSFEVKNV